MSAAGFTFLLGLSGLLAYLPGWHILGSLREDYIPMAPSTALCFMLLGMGLSLLHFKKMAGRPSIAALLAAMVLLFGLVELFALLDSGIDVEAFLFPDYGAWNNISAGRMSPATASLLFLAAALLLLFAREEYRAARSLFLRYLRNSLNLMLALLSFAFCLAYLFESPFFYSNADIIPMALSTALGFLGFSLASLTLSRDHFPLRRLIGTSTRSYLLRHILPLSIGSVLLGSTGLFFATQHTEVHPAITASLLTALVVLASGVLATLISERIGQVIDRKNNALESVHLSLRESEAQYEHLFRTMSLGIVYQNTLGEIIRVNPAAERILGLTTEQMQGRTSMDPRWKAVDENFNELPGDKHPAMLALQRNEKVEDFIQGIFNPAINDYVWIIVNSVLQYKENESAPFQVVSTFLEITHLRKAEEALKVLKEGLEDEVVKKNKELVERVAQLEAFYEATINREYRINELKQELDQLKEQGDAPY